MKTKYILFAVTLLLGFSSCSKNDEGNTELTPESSEMVTVSLALGGEVITSEQPLSRAEETSSTDLYGVQVYEEGNKYAHGLFDNVADMKINLTKDKTYKFVVTLVKNGKNIIDNAGGYSYPFISYRSYRQANFMSYDYRISTVNNYFIYDSYGYKDDVLQSGYTSLDSYSDVYYPETDRFYGELSGYIPTVNGTANIELKRTAFGLRYEIENLTDGSISLNVSKTFTPSSTSITETFIDETGVTESETEGRIFTFKDVYACWQLADDYSESVTVSISWLRGIGVTVPLGSVNVQVKRNVMNVLKINLAASDGDATIGITTEDDSSMTGEGVEVPLE